MVAAIFEMVATITWKRFMPNRKRLAREKLEIYLVHLILMYRRMIFVIGLFLLGYAITFLVVTHITGYAALIPAIFLLLLGSSYKTIIYTARLGAWIGTIWRYDD